MEPVGYHRVCVGACTPHSPQWRRLPPLFFFFRVGMLWGAHFKSFLGVYRRGLGREGNCRVLLDWLRRFWTLNDGSPWGPSYRL